MLSQFMLSLLLVIMSATVNAASDSARDKAWRDQIAQTLHLPATLPPLAVESHGRFEPEPGVVAERVSYATQFGMRVPAILYLPQKHSGKIPAIIVVNGHGGDKYSWYAYYTGVLYARAGAAVLTYDPLGEGERNPEKRSGARAHDNLKQIPELGPHMAGQMITDVRQAVSYLSQRPEVDARRIAAVGYSLGSFVLSLTCAVETRINSCALVGGGNLDEPGGYWDRAKPLCSGWPYQSLKFLGDRAATLYALHASRGPTLIYNGLEDDVVNIPATGEPFLRDLQQRAAALHGSSTGVFEYAFEPGASHRPFFITRLVALWLEQRLDFPNWTEASISAMPETHIGAWAMERGAEIDRLYATEQRELGTRALGANVPVLSRRQLSVFPDREWDARKAQLTIDYWDSQVRRELSDQSVAAVEVVKDGRPRATVILSAEATAEEREAAQELVQYVERATGARLPIAASADPLTVTRILVGGSASPPNVRRQIEKLQPDGYIIRVSPDYSIILAGQKRHGTSFAVYQFLERFLGVRWLWPGESGEVVPATKNLALDLSSRTEEPAYLWRSLGPGGALWGPYDRWEAELRIGISPEHQKVQRQWELRNRFGGARIYGGHSWGMLVPPAKYGAEHPEYFALVNGNRDSKAEGFDGKHLRQLCTTNPDVIRIVTEGVIRFFDEHPDYDGFSITGNDGRGFCECDRCRALDTSETQLERADPETGAQRVSTVITDRIITFSNQVAEGVAKKYPDKLLMVAAYGPYRRPPTKIAPHPNLMSQYCFEAHRHWNDESAKNDWTMTEGWSRLANYRGIYEYFIRGGFPDLPRLAPDKIEETVRRLSKMDYRYYQTQHGDGYAVNGFNYYLLGRLLWDPSLKWQDVMQDYTDKGFGQAAPAVRRYFQRMSDQWRSTGGLLLLDNATLKEYRRAAAAYPKSFRDTCRQDLEEALRLARGDERARVEFLVKGLRYVELTMQAIEHTIPLFEDGWDLMPQTFNEPPLPNWQDFDRAVAAWEERERYVESMKNDFVTPYFWIRYHAQERAFNPLRRLRAVKSQRSVER